MIRQTKEKKIPIKGLRTTKEQKPLKQTCIGCAKVKAIANKTKKLCATCVSTEKKEKQKLKKEHKKKVKQDTVTQSKLDQITSWLVRGAHKAECHACGVLSDPRGLHCAHFVGRTKQSTRYHLKNLLPACPKCNLYTPHHVWNLGKSLNSIWGEDTTEDMLQLSAKQLKLSNADRQVIYSIYRAALDKIEQSYPTQEEKYQILKSALKKYEEFVNSLIR